MLLKQYFNHLNSMIFIGLLLILFSGSSRTEGVKSLYEVEVPVVGQESSERNTAIRDAFGRMLVKITGNRKIAERGELAADISKAPRYVQQYRYRLAPVEIKPKPDAESALEVEPLRLLNVTFDAVAVDRLLRDRRLPIWSGNRPTTLVWLGTEQNGRRQLVLPDSTPELMSVLASSADSRGIPLLFPLMDLEDQESLLVSDLWGGFENNIWRASQRYSTDLILTGRLTRMTNDLWRANWRLYQGDRVSSWNDEGSNRQTLAVSGMQHVADLLADRFAPVGGDNILFLVRIKVEGIVDFMRYFSVNRFLQSISSVEHAEIAFAEEDAVTFDLQVRGGIQMLEQGLRLGHMLVPVAEVDDGQIAEDINLYYQVR
ncbi:DUF2066 domain-containing protein [Candidatus Vondammii sp. HM_W22]|uniref:DUF2066 domain-containing protein n=1 Tax=Candidatus Vondammii sp. HM_W22 TaxID=2687299 RepID=UPI002E7C04BD|nr:DUF2066 domain-containing protein [Candidatus Vondammii sp. HM_W22]